MPDTNTAPHHPDSPHLDREDAATAVREPEEDRSNESWGAWGENQTAQPDPEKSLLDVVEAAGTAQRAAHPKATDSAATEIPTELRNPTARDIRMETHDTDEVRMATEPANEASIA
ncbi:MAG: hypothetical protein K0Q72_3476 [Armatimonadetes bacterium]|nr:hypothetical protein [Armatimonadota bacterium]